MVTRPCGAGGNVPPTYTQLGFLFAADTSACDPGTLGLSEVLFSDPFGNSIPFCGSLDVPCPGVSLEEDDERRASQPVLIENAQLSLFSRCRLPQFHPHLLLQSSTLLQ